MSSFQGTKTDKESNRKEMNILVVWDIRTGERRSSRCTFLFYLTCLYLNITWIVGLNSQVTKGGRDNKWQTIKVSVRVRVSIFEHMNVNVSVLLSSNE